MRDFARAIRDQRKEAGYSSARAFYRRLGGRSFFGCTYKAYLNIESGRSTPHPRLAWSIASALRVSDHRRRGRQFIASYLSSLIGSEDLTGFLIQVLSGKDLAVGSEAMFQKASESSMSARTMPLTQEQVRLLYNDEAPYWCFTILSNDYGHWSEAELAGLLGLSSARLRAALASLISAGLLAQDKDKKFFCPHTGKVFISPRKKFFRPRFLELLKGHWTSLADRRGKKLMTQAALLRAPEAEFREFLPYLAQSVYGAHLYAKKERGPDTALFVIEASVRKLMPF